MSRKAVLPPSDVFGAMLRACRERRRWSQERLAGEAEIDQSLVSRCEAGSRRVSLVTVDRLCEALGLDGVEADRFRVAAGFSPCYADTLIADEPDVRMLYRLLHDEGIPASVRVSLRATVAALVRAIQDLRPSMHKGEMG